MQLGPRCAVDELPCCVDIGARARIVRACGFKDGQNALGGLGDIAGDDPQLIVREVEVASHGRHVSSISLAVSVRWAILSGLGR